MSGAVPKIGWRALLARIDALSRRERLMVLAAALALIGFIGDTVLLAPQRAQRLQLERDAARERSELAAMDGQIAELKRKLAADPDEVPRLRLQQLSSELFELNAGFQRLERSLVPPEQMARLLEQVMQRVAGISVVRLQTLPPSRLPERESDAAEASVQTGGAPEAASAPTQPSLWRHGVELTVRGSYADLVRYLDAVERLPVRVHFGRAVLDASQYPNVDLRLTVYTLGMDRAWLAL